MSDEHKAEAWELVDGLSCECSADEVTVCAHMGACRRGASAIAAALAAAEARGREMEIEAMRFLLAQKSATFPECREYAALASVLDARLASISAETPPAA